MPQKKLVIKRNTNKTDLSVFAFYFLLIIFIPSPINNKKTIMDYSISKARCSLIIFSVLLLVFGIALPAVSGIFEIMGSESGLEYLVLDYLGIAATIYIWGELFMYFTGHKMSALSVITIVYLILKTIGSVFMFFDIYFLGFAFNIISILESAAIFVWSILVFLQSHKEYAGLASLRGFVISTFCLYLLSYAIDEMYLNEFSIIYYLSLLEIVPLYFLFDFANKIMKEYSDLDTDTALS